MSFNHIKSKLQSESGFTIVELLIVIVVIGILAAITIVSYNGITARANTNSAKANATAFLKKAELYASEPTLTNRYPITAAEVQTAADANKSYYVNPTLTLGYSLAGTALTSSNPTATIKVLKCAATTQTSQADITSSLIVGLKAVYFDYTTNAEANLTVGNAFSCPDAA